jgi:hypothetical protein
VLYSALVVCWKISIDYEAIDEGCLQNAVKKWVPIVSGDELCIKIGSVLVSHIHTHLVLAVGINNDWYIKLFLAFSRQNPILHSVPLRRNSNNIHMNLNC